MPAPMARSARRARRAGFSLVETALAVAVVGIGILGVIGLFPAGLEMNRRAVNETYGALFAESVLYGVRAQFQQNPDLANLNSMVIPLDLPWAEASPNQIVPTTTPIKVILRSKDDAEAEDVAIWYRLDFIDVDWLDQGTREVRAVSRDEWTTGGTFLGTTAINGPWTSVANAVSQVNYGTMKRARLLLWLGHWVDRNHQKGSGGGRPQSDTPTLISYVGGGGGGPDKSVYYNDNVLWFYTELYDYR